MKKVLFAILLFLIFSAVWFYPLFSPLSPYLNDCIYGLNLGDKDDKQNLLYAEQNYHICLLALDKNNKMFGDTGWKRFSAAELYHSQYGYSLMFLTPARYKLIKESNVILDQVVLDTMAIASYNGKVYKNKAKVDKFIKRTEAVITPYRAYIELNSSIGVLESHKQFVYNKYIEKQPEEKEIVNSLPSQEEE